MKTFLSKGLGVLAIFAMTFNVALATPPQQITFCHVPPGNEGNPQTLTTGIQAYQNGHANHVNDYVGPCQGGNEETSQASCNLEANILTNGGFEATPVASGNWALFPNGSSGLGWSVAWQNPVGAPEVPNLEVHNSLWTPVSEGSQYAELDTDFGNPAGGAASVKISQTIPTVIGNDYEIGYDFSPRPGTGTSQNMLGVWLNGVQVDQKIADGTANSGNAWTHYVYSFTATGSSTTIGFSDNGTLDSLGTLLDNASVRCTEEVNQEETPSCDNNVIFARVVVTNVVNTGAGNASDTIYLGSGANTVASGEWFPLSSIDAGSIEAYADVPGIAVRRKPGNRIALELYGRYAGPYSSVGSEHVEGYIEFWNGVPTAQISAASGTGAKLEFVDTSMPSDVVSISGDKSNFNLSVNTGSDRFDTVYKFAKEDCVEVD